MKETLQQTPSTDNQENEGEFRTYSASPKRVLPLPTEKNIGEEVTSHSPAPTTTSKSKE